MTSIDPEQDVARLAMALGPNLRRELAHCPAFDTVSEGGRPLDRTGRCSRSLVLFRPQCKDFDLVRVKATA